MKSYKSLSEKIYDVLLHSFLAFCAVSCLYPFIYVLSMSISNTDAVIAQKVWLYPIGLNFTSYGLVFNTSHIFTFYANTLWYTGVGTLINLVMSVLAAYPLSREKFILRKIFMVFITFTMFVSGGLIPLFILVNKLGLYNTRWAIVLPAAVGAVNIILMRIYFQTAIPGELTESATVDGCSDIGILLKIILPLSTPILAVITLFVAVGFWNDYFSAVIFLPNPKLQPITIFLQKILIGNQAGALVNVSSDPSKQMSFLRYATQIKYAVVIITILPIVCIYPFLQKYFVKGIMLGALKG